MLIATLHFIETIEDALILKISSDVCGEEVMLQKSVPLQMRIPDPVKDSVQIV